jgi:hypothetical protein
MFQSDAILKQHLILQQNCNFGYKLVLYVDICFYSLKALRDDFVVQISGTGSASCFKYGDTSLSNKCQ